MYSTHNCLLDKDARSWVSQVWMLKFQRRIYNILNLKIFNHISSMLQTLTANTNENFKKDVQLLLVYEIHSFTEKKVIVFGYR